MEIELEKTEDGSKPDEQEMYVLPVAVRETETPGPFYYLTDVLFA